MKGSNDVDGEIDILIVDDQIKTCRGLKALLRFAPFVRTIWQATDGESAMRIVSEVKPDVVIMDVRMPIMGGIEATRQIKHSYPEVKIIIHTMYSFYETEALAAGADRFLVKGDPAWSIQDEIISLFPSLKTTKSST
jgi:YesN/AraC family two-component response regulator